MSIFYRLLLINIFSSAGDGLFKLTLPLLVLSITGSATDMALTFALTYLPYLIFSLLGGVAADRYSRKKILFLGNLFCFILLPLLVWVGVGLKLMSVFYGIVFLIASVSPLVHPSLQSLIPDLVKAEKLARANSLISTSEYLIQITAPALAGILVALVGANNAVYINALFFIIAAIGTLFLPIEQEKVKKANSSVLNSIREGFTIAWSHPVLKYGSLLFVASNFSINIVQANLVFYLSEVLGASPQVVGIDFAIFGIGAIIGATIAPSIVHRFPAGRIIIGTSLAGGSVSALLWLAKDPFVVAIVWAIVYLVGAVTVVTFFTLRQKVVAREVLGRTVAVTRLISFSSIPVAAILGGFLLEHLGMSMIILLCVVVRLGAACLMLASPLVKEK
ncbi:MFS transporter [Suttonella ornithocola]|uniref:Probable multidrug-efflux transporter Rv1258c/MT1297 n=1 Tax=Suttonella ornithocola TaxID=279832 RepID=A0A380MPT0_9GAMM|nr:MFS transporter [Suttonella ornithocola]SUO93317.1 Probable multidrug-efflux transporter Rv1258c/MT1297 [Suttonella ornithocola]